MTRPTHAVLACLAAIFSLTGGAVAQSTPSPPPPGLLVDVGGYRLHLHCMGDGSPAVVIDGGTGAWSIHYRETQERAAGITKSCAYDRAGLGWSDASPSSRTSRRMAEELHALLEAAGVPPPYVLIGHSLGGYNARLFAHLFPDDIAGIVLAEAAHEDQWSRLPEQAAGLLEAGIEGIRVAAEAARRGELREAALAPWEGAPHLHDAYMAAMLAPRTYVTMAAELEQARTSAEQVAETGGVGDTPLVVLTARNSFAAFAGTGIPIDPANEAWIEMQEELLDLSSDSEWLISDTGDHRIQRTDPDLLLEAIRRVVAKARRLGRIRRQILYADFRSLPEQLCDDAATVVPLGPACLPEPPR